MKNILIACFLLLLYSCKNENTSIEGRLDINSGEKQKNDLVSEDKQNSAEAEKQKIASLIDKWHQAAADANFEAYFNLFAKKAVFIGTDAKEVWNKNEFKAYAKPYFDEGEAWAFTSKQRDIYVADGDEIAWFNELLDTHFGPCRGSGVAVIENGKWKIKHYVLSFAIPNSLAPQVTKLKLSQEE